MKLLIIDDEKLTREGLIESINWSRLGIDEIYEADDGVNGLKQARALKPDIIVSDVRMPRKNGIEMCRELVNTLPDSSIIFMSGYSDKEYLKAAINLKAISYVEKPIDAAEFEEALHNAVDQQRLNARNQATFHSHNKFMQDKLSLEIIYTPLKKKVDEYLHQFQELGIPLKVNSEFTTLILHLNTAISRIPEPELNSLFQSIEDIVQKYNMKHIFGIKNDEYIVLHLFTDHATGAYYRNRISEALANLLSQSYPYYISVGKTVNGILNVYQSYHSAVLLMQCSFFYDYNSVIVSREQAAAPVVLDSDLYRDFEAGLNPGTEDKAMDIAQKLYHRLKDNQSLLPATAKEIYYRLSLIIYQTASSKHIAPFYEEESNSTILDSINKYNNLTELHQLLLHKIKSYYTSMEKEKQENAIIFAIKEFINKNYSNENLSVKDISEEVFLSSTYVCTLFKNETGQTLNQYLTDYRIEKAKVMLKDCRYKITDISSKAGYSDGNYFSKAFKKLVGMSPSEYRERYGK